MDTLLIRGTRSWLAIAAIATAATAGCSATTATAATAHLDSHQLPVAGQCTARPGWAAMTLTDTSPAPKVTVPVGGHLVVTVPHWNSGTATDVRPAHAGIVREQCTVVLPDHGRRTIFLAARPGSTSLGATVQPASGLMMPTWHGTVTVRAGRG